MNEQSMQSVFVAVPLDRVAGRMPAMLQAEGVVLSLAAAGATADRLRFDGSWSADGATGVIDLDVTRVSPTASQVEVTLVAQGAHDSARSRARRDRQAAAVAAAVAAQLERRPSPAPRSRQPRRRPRIVVPVAAGLVTLSVVAASALLVPSAVTLEAATARYREAVAASAAIATPDARSATPQQATARSRDAGDVADGGTPRRRRGARVAATPTRPTTDGARAATVTLPPAGASQSGARGTNDQRRGAAARETKVVPDPGVYRYATDGWEEVDAPGGHRRFPRETTQTVVRTDCGYRMRWDPLEERWDENFMCVRDGTPQPAEHRTYRSFFGRAVEQHFVCRPAKAPRGAVWAVTCDSDDTTMTTVARSLGRRTLRVDGEDVEVSGLQVDSDLEGANRGRRTAVLWHARASGILVRTEVAAQLEVDGPFGAVDYREQYTLHLASQTPHQ